MRQPSWYLDAYAEIDLASALAVRGDRAMCIATDTIAPETLTWDDPETSLPV